ncbi:MAG: lipoprotein [Gallionella sp.]|nr:lipoprotein [Gallionella sp.]
MRLFNSLVIMLAISLLLQGCGRKGPLTMPVAQAPKTAVPAAVHAVPVNAAASAVPATPVTTPVK